VIKFLFLRNLNRKCNAATD